MWHVRIDLHRQTLVVAAVNDTGEVRPIQRLECSDTAAIIACFQELRPFRAVIEATGTYRWLYKLLLPMGSVVLAHPLRLRAMLVRRSKTDRLDAQLLANLLRLNQIPLSYIPSEDYQLLRDLIRYRTTLSRQVAQAKIHLRQLLARENVKAPSGLSVRPARPVLVQPPGLWPGREQGAGARHRATAMDGQGVGGDR
jgi:transposase